MRNKQAKTFFFYLSMADQRSQLSFIEKHTREGTNCLSWVLIEIHLPIALKWQDIKMGILNYTKHWFTCSHKVRKETSEIYYFLIKEL